MASLADKKGARLVARPDVVSQRRPGQGRRSLLGPGIFRLRAGPGVPPRGRRRFLRRAGRPIPARPSPGFLPRPSPGFLRPAVYANRNEIIRRTVTFRRKVHMFGYGAKWVRCTGWAAASMRPARRGSVKRRTGPGSSKSGERQR